MNNNTEKPDKNVKFQDPNKGQSVICKFYKDKLVSPSNNGTHVSPRNNNHTPITQTYKSSTTSNNQKQLKSLEDKGKDLKTPNFNQFQNIIKQCKEYDVGNSKIPTSPNEKKNEINENHNQNCEEFTSKSGSKYNDKIVNRFKGQNNSKLFEEYWHYLQSTRKKSTLPRTKTDLIQRMNVASNQEKDNNQEDDHNVTEKNSVNFKKGKVDLVVDLKMLGKKPFKSSYNFVMSDNTRIDGKNVCKTVNRRKNLFSNEKNNKNADFEKKVIVDQKMEETKEQKNKVPNLNFEGKLNLKVSDCLEIDTRKRNSDKKKELSSTISNNLGSEYNIFDSRNKSIGNVFNELNKNRSLILEKNIEKIADNIVNKDSKPERVKNQRLLSQIEHNNPSIYDRSKPSRQFAPKSSSPIVIFQSEPIESENFVAYDKTQNKISITRTKKQNSFISQQFSNSQNLETSTSPRREFFTKEVRKKNTQKRNIVSPIKNEDFDIIEEHDLLCEISSYSDEKIHMEDQRKKVKKEVDRPRLRQIDNEAFEKEDIVEINNQILDGYKKNYLKKQLMKKKRNMKKLKDEYEKYKYHYSNFQKYAKDVMNADSLESSDEGSFELMDDEDLPISPKMQKFTNKKKVEEKKQKVDIEEIIKDVSSTSPSNIEYDDTCIKKAQPKKWLQTNNKNLKRSIITENKRQEKEENLDADLMKDFFKSKLSPVRSFNESYLSKSPPLIKRRKDKDLSNTLKLQKSDGMLINDRKDSRVSKIFRKQIMSHIDHLSKSTRLINLDEINFDSPIKSTIFNVKLEDKESLGNTIEGKTKKDDPEPNCILENKEKHISKNKEAFIHKLKKSANRRASQINIEGEEEEGSHKSKSSSKKSGNNKYISESVVIKKNNKWIKNSMVEPKLDGFKKKYLYEYEMECQNDDEISRESYLYDEKHVQNMNDPQTGLGQKQKSKDIMIITKCNEINEKKYFLERKKSFTGNTFNKKDSKEKFDDMINSCRRRNNLNLLEKAGNNENLSNLGISQIKGRSLDSSSHNKSTINAHKSSSFIRFLSPQNHKDYENQKKLITDSIKEKYKFNSENRFNLNDNKSFGSNDMEFNLTNNFINYDSYNKHRKKRVKNFQNKNQIEIMGKRINKNEQCYEDEDESDIEEKKYSKIFKKNYNLIQRKDVIDNERELNSPELCKEIRLEKEFRQYHDKSPTNDAIKSASNVTELIKAKENLSRSEQKRFMQSMDLTEYGGDEKERPSYKDEWLNNASLLYRDKSPQFQQNKEKFLKKNCSRAKIDSSARENMKSLEKESFQDLLCAKSPYSTISNTSEQEKEIMNNFKNSIINDSERRFPNKPVKCKRNVLMYGNVNLQDVFNKKYVDTRRPKTAKFCSSYNEGDYETQETKQKDHDLNYLVSQRNDRNGRDNTNFTKCFSKNKKDEQELIVELANLKELNELWFKDEEFLSNLDFNIEEMLEFENFNDKLRDMIKSKNIEKTKARGKKS